jgi:predicted Fe-Mo cluster-binding NifX family protein
LAHTLLTNIIAMKIAIPHWQGRVSPVFDESQELFLIDIENHREINRAEIKLRHSNPLLRAGAIADLGAEVLICGAISLALEKALLSKNIEVIAYTCGQTKDVIDAFLKNKLSDPTFLMPGCRRERRPGKIHEPAKFDADKRK